MNATFGIMDAYEKRVRSKRERYGLIAERALKKIGELRENV